ncbi:MAG: GDP-mannose 4,6-dehydratase [Anaerolineales bacterium]|nr:GDP-mannose 4,6-dehydratase [Anaerolineales bacterium]
MESMAMNAGFWLDRPTLVTGATGLVGSWVVKGLVERGAQVVCLVRDWVPQSELARARLLEQVMVARGDVRDQELLERLLGEYEVDTVIHLAAQTIVSIANRNPVSTFDTNIRGAWALLEACRRSPQVKQVVVASSDKAYGDQAEMPTGEDSPLQGRHPYDASKSCADLIAHAYAVTYELPVAITRCGNFYGGGDLNWNRLIPGTIRSVLRGRPPLIRSDGQFVRDYFYVEDGALAYLLLAEKLAGQPELRGQAFNFSYENRLTVLEVTERLLRLMGSPLKPEILNQVTNEIRVQSLSAEKARNLLGWSPAFTLDESLSRTIDWYRDYFSHEPLST